MTKVSPIKKAVPKPVSINAEYLRLAQLFCSTDKTRYYLMGVQIEPHPDGGILLVGINGHIAGVFYDRTGYVPEPMLLDLDKPFIASLKSSKSETDGRRVTIQDNRLVTMVVDSDDKFIQKKYIKPGLIEIDGTYPDWRRILPSPDRNISVPCFNSGYIKIFQTVAKSLTRGKAGGVKLTAGPDNGSIAVTVVHEDFFGALMPMRHQITDCRPPWLA